MRKVRIVENEAWEWIETEWVPLDCYRDSARRYSRWCAAWQEEAAVRVVELFEALDVWLSAGGCLPRGWAR